MFTTKNFKLNSQDSATRKLNIVLAATGISSIACDIYLNELGKRLLKRGHQVWTIRVNPDKKTLNKDDIPVYWPGPKWKILWLLYLFCPYFFDREISRIVIEGIRKIKAEIDIVDLEIPSLAYGYQKLGHEKLIIRGWYYPHHLWQRLKIMWEVTPKNLVRKLIFMIRQAWHYFGDEYGFKKADAIITLTARLTSQLKKRGFTTAWVPRGTEILWIPLGTRAHRRIKKVSRKEVKLGCVVYDLESPRKGIRFLLSAIKILENSNFDKNSYQIELVGGYSPKLEKTIESLGLKKRINLLGKLNHQQVLKKLKDWDIFVFPTLFEELSLATIEALPAGLVPVGWDIESLKACWGNAGVFLPKKNVQKLANVLAKLILSPALRKKIGQKAQRRAQKFFDWKVIIPRLERLFFRLTKESV